MRGVSIKEEFIVKGSFGPSQDSTPCQLVLLPNTQVRISIVPEGGCLLIIVPKNPAVYVPVAESLLEPLIKLLNLETPAVNESLTVAGIIGSLQNLPSEIKDALADSIVESSRSRAELTQGDPLKY